jgi:hypothetical protein
MKLKIVVIIALSACFITIVGLIFQIYFTDSTVIDTTEQKKIMINIALSDNRVKSYLDNRIFTISNVSVGQRYVLFYIGNTSEYWNKLLVGIDIVNNNTTYIYLANQFGSKVNPQSSDPDKEANMINIALSNETIKEMLNNQRYVVQSIDLDQQSIWFSIGEPYYSREVHVVFDQDKVIFINDKDSLRPPPIFTTN